MSVGDPKSRFGHDLAQENVVLKSQLAGGDLDAFALTLAQHPRMAADMGLGALTPALRSTRDMPAATAGRPAW